jgi:hypothetical protein
MPLLPDDACEVLEFLKMDLLQVRATEVKEDIAGGNAVDGDAFFDDSILYDEKFV